MLTTTLENREAQLIVKQLQDSIKILQASLEKSHETNSAVFKELDDRLDTISENILRLDFRLDNAEKTLESIKTDIKEVQHSLQTKLTKEDFNSSLVRFGTRIGNLEDIAREEEGKRKGMSMMYKFLAGIFLAGVGIVFSVFDSIVKLFQK